MRRAIFRITGESSTTRTCFTFGLQGCIEGLSGVRNGTDVEDAERIEDRKNLGSRPDNAGHNDRLSSIDVLRRRRYMYAVSMHYFADFLDRQGKGFGAQFDRDRQRTDGEGVRIGIELTG